MKKISEMSNEEIIRLQLEQKEKIRRINKIKAWIKLIMIIIMLCIMAFIIVKCVSGFDPSSLDSVTNNSENSEEFVTFIPNYFR
ncbi:MAG: hypothetical protein IKQ04_01965 [Oscillospiraceae bacterium]|nr:hypothetical protein [Oscillospiraceae bacterium]